MLVAFRQRPRGAALCVPSVECDVGTNAGAGERRAGKAAEWSCGGRTPEDWENFLRRKRRPELWDSEKGVFTEMGRQGDKELLVTRSFAST